MDIEALQKTMRQAFRVEAADLLLELDTSMLELESNPQDADLLNRVFRAIHTIKGSGATAGFTEMAAFTHHVEELFDEARMGRLTITPEMIDLALQAKDLIGQLMESENDPALGMACTQVVTALAKFLPHSTTTPSDQRKVAQAGGPQKQQFIIFFKPHYQVFFSGTDPVTLVDELCALGENTVTVRAGEIPAMESFNPEHCYLAWEMVLVSEHPIEKIKEVFIFVEDESEIRIAIQPELESVPTNPLDAFLNIAQQSMDALGTLLPQLTGSMEEESEGLKNYLRVLKTFRIAASNEDQNELVKQLDEQIVLVEPALLGKTALSEQTKTDLAEGNTQLSTLIQSLNERKGTLSKTDPQAAVAPEVSTGARKETTHGSGTIRVDQDKLDRLMRSVGELLVARNALPILAKRLALEQGHRSMSKEIRDAGTHISHIADDLQAALMSIRMMPIRTVFQRFPRMVRDICRGQNKEAELFMEGESTELDKTVIEQIADPLVHLVRNAADHGIELPDAREQVGKSRIGRITLKAYNKDHNVVIEIQDDGHGMDVSRLKQKALEKGLITPAAAASMSDQSALELIFLPGFSTAEKVTDISGRGVGMDVVRSNISQLHGTITLQSTLGSGSLMTIMLPASLMVSKGIMVKSDTEEYVFPIESVMQTMKLPGQRIHCHDQSYFMSFRDEVYPVVRLADHFASHSRFVDIEWPEEVAIAIVQTNRGKIGIAVDRFLGDVEVIVKPMGPDFENLTIFQGATIMGDGRIALVINPAGFVN